MPLHYYAVLDDRARQALEFHLEDCAACARLWDETRCLLGSVEPSYAFPREGEVDWRRFARATALRARAADREKSGGILRPFPGLRSAAGWVGVAAAAILVVALAMALRAPAPGFLPGSPAAEPPGGSARVLQEGLARQGAVRYLRDSRSILVNLLQGPVRCRKDGGGLDVAFEKERSRDLLRRKNLYERSLDGLRDRRLAALVAQLEPFLLQVSSLSDCAAAPQIHDLREQIERRQILLRIDLMTREVERSRFRA
jgi:hypothetical protein